MTLRPRAGRAGRCAPPTITNALMVALARDAIEYLVAGPLILPPDEPAAKLRPARQLRACSWQVGVRGPVVLLDPRIFPDAGRPDSDGGVGRVARVLPAPRHRLRRHHHGGAETRAVLAVCDPRDH